MSISQPHPIVIPPSAVDDMLKIMQPVIEMASARQHQASWMPKVFTESYNLFKDRSVDQKVTQIITTRLNQWIEQLNSPKGQYYLQYLQNVLNATTSESTKIALGEPESSTALSKIERQHKIAEHLHESLRNDFHQKITPTTLILLIDFFTTNVDCENLWTTQMQPSNMPGESAFLQLPTMDALLLAQNFNQAISKLTTPEDRMYFAQDLLIKRFGIEIRNDKVNDKEWNNSWLNNQIKLVDQIQPNQPWNHLGDIIDDPTISHPNSLLDYLSHVTGIRDL